MQERATEGLHHAAVGLDTVPGARAARLLHESQCNALAQMAPALDQIWNAAQEMARTLKSGGNLIYAAAGSSGLMAAADALELPGTFGIPPDRIRILMAGGLPSGSEMPGHVEDDTDAAKMASRQIAPEDTVIAVTASGTTPYVLEIARNARATGAKLIAMANNAGAPLFHHADVEICLPTPPELLSGSTRLGAGTAQKVALNTMSTLMGIALGHVHDGMMVNVRADNTKLKRRSAGIVAKIAATTQDAAMRHLETSGGDVKTAVLLGKGAGSRAGAESLLKQAGGHLRTAMNRLGNHE